MTANTTAAAPLGATSGADIADWRPEDNAFWEAPGKKVAYRNLWISVPALLCGFAIWGMWGIITVQMLNLGFPFTQAELFTLTAIAGISGATMRKVNVDKKTKVFPHQQQSKCCHDVTISHGVDCAKVTEESCDVLSSFVIARNHMLYLIREQVAHLRHIINETSSSGESRDVKSRGASECMLNSG